MNKAFVREPDEPDDAHCPRCGAIGSPVGAATIAAHLREGQHSPLASSAFFCGGAACEVVYFDANAQTITTPQLRAAIYPKHPAAPICACFGLHADDVAADARAGNAAGVRMLIERAGKQAERCALLAANGKCCVDEVQRVFLKHWRR